jgi:hypothetical protein
MMYCGDDTLRALKHVLDHFDRGGVLNFFTEDLLRLPLLSSAVHREDSRPSPPFQFYCTPPPRVAMQAERLAFAG